LTYSTIVSPAAIKTASLKLAHVGLQMPITSKLNLPFIPKSDHMIALICHSSAADRHLTPTCSTSLQPAATRATVVAL